MISVYIKQYKHVNFLNHKFYAIYNKDKFSTIYLKNK